MGKLELVRLFYFNKKRYVTVLISFFLILTLNPTPATTGGNLELVENVNWTILNPSGNPGARDIHRMVYYESVDKMIAFGGDTDSQLYDGKTWEYDPGLNKWTDRSPIVSPTGRSGHDMVYDSQNNIILLFGGSSGVDLSDTLYYNYTVNTWVALSPTTSPGERSHHVMAYDSFNHKVIMFGGANSTDFLQDTWAYDFATNTWTEMHPATSPNPRTSSSLTYHPGMKKMVLYGGYDNNFPYGDTWTYDYATDTWERLNPSVSPYERWDHATVYDSKNQQILLFGGHIQPINSNAADVWAFDSTTMSWELVHYGTGGNPSVRTDMAMAYDTLRQNTIMYGGQNGPRYSDTWKLEYDRGIFTSSPNVPYLHSTMMYGGDGDDVTYSSVLTSNGALCLVGDTSSTNFVGAVTGSQDPFYLCQDAEGHLTQKSRVTLADYDTFFGVGAFSDNNLLYAGTSGGASYFARNNVFPGSSFSTSSGNVYIIDAVTDSYNNILLVGWTDGTIDGGQLVSGYSDITFNGGARDGFLYKFNPAGAFQWSTYIGGSGTDMTESVVVDSQDNIWVKTHTDSTGLYTSPGAPQSTHSNAGEYYIQKFLANGTLTFATYFGGAGDEKSDWTHQSTVDSQDNYIFSGYTDSLDYPITIGALNETDNGGATDGVVTKLDPNGNVLFSSYIGGNGADYIQVVEVDMHDNIIATGFTDSTSIPLKNAFQSTLHGAKDGVFFNVSSDGSTLYQSSFLGGLGDDFIRDVEIRDNGKMTFVGYTQAANNFPGWDHAGLGPSGFDIFLSEVYADQSNPVVTETTTLPPVTTTQPAVNVTFTEPGPTTTVLPDPVTVTSERTKTVGNKTETVTSTQSSTPFFIIPVAMALLVGKKVQKKFT